MYLTLEEIIKIKENNLTDNITGLTSNFTILHGVERTIVFLFVFPSKKVWKIVIKI